MSGRERKRRSRSRSRSPRDSRKHDERSGRDRDRDTYRDSERHRDSYKRRDRKYRSRSRSVERDRGRDDSYRSSGRKHDRRRSRSRSPRRRRHDSRERYEADRDDDKGHSQFEESNIVNDEEADAMASMMGFSNFSTTKGQHVHGNSGTTVAKVQKPKHYRQYMNRRGGFNRPLDPIH